MLTSRSLSCGGLRPASSLDVSVQAEILNLQNDLRAEHKLTFVMVSHDLSVVGHVCEGVEVMDIETMRAMPPGRTIPSTFQKPR
ncbi:hypothetical protein [Aliiruegeria lutimaris]|uniref:hypothetical protein n=1 Tax=Aliiruegeria lutimaris TaxID=571298 RepID=UPI003CC7A7CE